MELLQPGSLAAMRWQSCNKQTFTNNYINKGKNLLKGGYHNFYRPSVALFPIAVNEH